MATKIETGGGYQAGYDDGYDDGNTAGYSKGHTDGYNSGYSKGNTDGYAAGKVKLLYLTKNGTSDVIKTSETCYAHICANIYYGALYMYFEGSNDNSNWIVIEKREGGGGDQYMDVWNWTGNGYKYYRLRVTSLQASRFSACLFG